MKQKDISEIVVYQPDEITKLEVRIQGETVWLTQAQIALIFNVGRPAVTKHIRNIYACGELEENSTCSILEHMGNDGLQSYNVRYFNLDVILSVGYRVNSKNAIAFRRWASGILKEYLMRGVVHNDLSALFVTNKTVNENCVKRYLTCVFERRENHS